MISNLRKFIVNNTPIQETLNKLGGLDYGCYDRSNVIVGSKVIDYFVTFDGAKYKVDGYSNSMIEETRLEYDWSDIRADDIVLDIGANIGGFTIGAALKAKHVYALEPIFYPYLETNVKLNALTNVTVFPFAIGDGRNLDLSFNKINRRNVPTYTLTNLINMIRLQSNGQHNVSFLKCDCEGGEWYIKPAELDGIRRIEMEIHPAMDPTESYSPHLIPHLKQNWDTKITDESRITPLIHAHKKTVRD